MVPVYATALGLRPDTLDPLFEGPLYRLRMTRYPPMPSTTTTTTSNTTNNTTTTDNNKKQKTTTTTTATFAINPHLDTSFFTVLASNAPGLVVYSHKHDKWLRAPHKEGHFIVNSGIVLRTMSNDHWLATKHYATPPDSADRISLPFFFNPHPAQV
jgi:isopenicillin N synthase-like dioxygenase